jgi:PTH1 family peptidyl-tRNA hydrolase
LEKHGLIELSCRGHNGVKSVQTALGKNKMPFTRICVGIGRPESRDPKDVSSYVLRKMTSKEKNMLGESAHECMKIIRNITDGVI